MNPRIISVRPSLEPYREYMLDGVRSTRASGVLVTFLGVSTLLIKDGTTALMTDGFFTRPGLFQIMRSNIEPDASLVAHSLQRCGAQPLAAVVVVHSHYDHAFDSPIVAQQTGAMLVGSESTANIGRGYGLPEDRIAVLKAPQTLEFGAFALTFVKSAHAPYALYPGPIASPVVPPARVSDYAEGECYSIFIARAGRTALVHASAGFVPGALEGRKADVIYLGVGALGKLGATYQEDYWREVVLATGARRVILIHWDDFWKPLSEPLVPQPHFMDDFDNTMRFVLERGRRDGVDVRIPTAWVAADPFAG
jgi:L-ascorbate metabolism protein UlaG (beta-lactamase superfamily)